MLLFVPMSGKMGLHEFCGINGGEGVGRLKVSAAA